MRRHSLKFIRAAETLFPTTPIRNIILNWSNEGIFLTSLDIVFHNLAASYLKEFLPYFAVSAVFIYLKLYILFLMVTRSCKNSGPFLCIILKVSKAIALIYVQQYTSFSCIWCLHLAIDSLCKGQ